MNVVFDIGAVLVDFDWDAFVGSMFDAETGLSISTQTRRTGSLTRLA